MIERSDSLTELFKALSKAQGAIKPALKDSINPHLKSKYADLGSVWEACREVLAENGLNVTQWPTTSDGPGVTLVTVLGHTSGEYMMAAYTMPTLKADAQGYGSALTYARRYALSAVLGIVADDDDGAAASTPPQSRQQAPRSAPQPSAPATIGNERAQGLQKQLSELLGETSHREKPHTVYAGEVIEREVKSLSELTPAEAKAVYTAAQSAQQAAA